MKKFKPIKMESFKLTEKQMEALVKGAQIYLRPEPDPSDDEKPPVVDKEDQTAIS